MVTNNKTNTSNPVTVAQGGTGLQTLTVHSLYVGNGTSNPTALAVGTTNQVLQANTGANPGWSTATYPPTSGGTGKILRADGTNWVETTATYPDTAGTSGNVLTSDGTNWNSSAATGPQGLTYVSGNLTSSQIKNLHGTPITLVSAPSAGQVLIVVSPAYSKFNYGGTNAFTAAAAQKIVLAYGTGASGLTNITLIDNTTLKGTASSYMLNRTVNILTLNSLASYEALPIVAINQVVTEISGNAANNNTLSYGFYYYTVTLT